MNNQLDISPSTFFYAEKKGSFFWVTVLVMIEREWRRLLMEPSRVFGVLLQPLLFLIVFGAGFHDSFHLKDSDVNYATFFFPGILGLVVLFSSIYATLTLVDDKRCGFFRLVLLGPSGVRAALIGKVMATTTLGFLQALLFTPLIFFLPVDISLIALITLLLFLIIGSLCFAIIGVLFAWISPTPSAFHALMSVILIPLWLLSGAMFPVHRGILYTLSFFNPMAYLVEGLRILIVRPNANAFPSLMIVIFFVVINVFLLALVVKKRPLE